MTLEELNEHLCLVQALEEMEEMLVNLEIAAQPGAQKLSGMPHAPGISDKIGDYAVEIADLRTDIEDMKEQIKESEECISQWLRTIKDGTTRIVFRLRFLRGKQWKEVAGIVGRWHTEASVKMICYRYLDYLELEGEELL